MFASVGNQDYHLYFLDVETFCFHHQMFTMLLLCMHQIRLLDWEKYYMSYGFWHLALQWSVPGETYDSYPASLTLLINFANVLVCKNSNCALVSAYEVECVSC